jgi:hypothetical protein
VAVTVAVVAATEAAVVVLVVAAMVVTEQTATAVAVPAEEGRVGPVVPVGVWEGAGL